MLLDKSIVIRAPPEEVFAWLAPARMPRWDRTLVRASRSRLGEGPLERGARFGRVHRLMGHRFETEAEAVAVEANRLFAWRQLDGDYAQHQGAFHLEPVAEGTRLRLSADVEYPYRMPMMVTEEELRESLSREADEALFALKELAESHARLHGHTAGAAAASVVRALSAHAS